MQCASFDGLPLDYINCQYLLPLQMGPSGPLRSSFITCVVNMTVCKSILVAAPFMRTQALAKVAASMVSSPCSSTSILKKVSAFLISIPQWMHVPFPPTMYPNLLCVRLHLYHTYIINNIWVRKYFGNYFFSMVSIGGGDVSGGGGLSLQRR